MKALSIAQQLDFKIRHGYKLTIKHPYNKEFTIYEETSDNDWISSFFNYSENKTILQQLGLIIPNSFKLEILHPLNKDCIIYEENNKGEWSKYEYNDNQQQIFQTDSNGDWYKCEYDEQTDLLISEEYSNGVKSIYEYSDDNEEGIYLLKFETEFDGINTIKYEYDENEVVIGYYPLITIQ